MWKLKERHGLQAKGNSWEEREQSENKEEEQEGPFLLWAP